VSERRYNEEEVVRILSVAVDDPSDEATGAGATGGLTLRELKEIGAEVGIDAARIESAALAVSDRAHVAPVGRVLGMPTTLLLERTAPIRVTEAELPRLLDVIRTDLARQGIVGEVLGGFEWKARSAMGGRYVSIRPEGEGTRIRVFGNFRDGLMVLALGMGPISAAGIGALLESMGVVGLPAVAGALVAGAAVALTPWRALFGREARSLTRVADRLEQTLLEIESGDG
jgi:hypothetical protein